MAAMLGQANLALGQDWRSFATGHQAYLTLLEQLCGDLAQTCDAMALEAEYTKLGAAVLGYAATRGEHVVVGATIGSLGGAVDTQAGSLARGHGSASAEETGPGQLTGAVSGARQGYDGHDEDVKIPDIEASTLEPAPMTRRSRTAPSWSRPRAAPRS